MFLDWVPDQDLLKAYAFRSGLTLENFGSTAIAGFVLHHDAKGLAQTEKQWLAALVGWVKSDLTRAARSTAGKTSAQQSSSFDDDDTSWLDGGNDQ